MTTTNEPRSEVVLLEPSNRSTLEDDRAALIATIESELPAEIVSPFEYAAVADLELRVSRFIDKAKPPFDSVTSSAHQTWKNALALKAAFFEPLERLKAAARSRLAAYAERQEKIRRDEQRRIEAEEREREQQRIKAEAKALEKSGQPELAAIVRHQPIDLPPVELPSNVPDVAGLSDRDEWTWEPTDGDTPRNRAIAVLSMVAKKEYAQYLKLDDAALTAFAKRSKGTIDIPGIRIYSRKVIVRRR